MLLCSKGTQQDKNTKPSLHNEEWACMQTSRVMSGASDLKGHLVSKRKTAPFGFQTYFFVLIALFKVVRIPAKLLCAF